MTWVAHYNDGSELHQADGATYPDIERARLVAFDLWLDGRLVLRLDLKADSHGPKQLVWRARNQLDSLGNHNRVHLAGWVQEGGRQVMCYVFEDGAVLVAGGWRTDVDFMYPVTLQRAERAA